MLSVHPYLMAFPNPNPFDESLYTQQQPQAQGPQLQGYPQHESPNATTPGGASSSSASTPMAYQGGWDFGTAPPPHPTLHPATFSPHESYGAVDFAPPPGPPPPSVAEVQYPVPTAPATIRLEEKQPLIPKEIRTRSRARVRLDM